MSEDNIGVGATRGEEKVDAPVNYTNTKPVREKAFDEVFCQDCGNPIKAKAEICPKCGVRQKKESDKNKTTAALLALFLGGFGVHKFYLGKTGLGIVYLVFFWTFIPAVIAFIEGIMLLCMSDEKFNNTVEG